jgi:glycosyltransferase involved in cell wall biosynthesis/SAM-dependent methyltransferase
MRIGLDFRFLSYGRSALNRGVGRYSQQQLREVLRLDHQNQYVLVCRPDADRSSLDPAITAAKNVKTVKIPAALCKPNPAAYQPEEYLRTGSQSQRWLDQLDLDLYHVPVPFLFIEPRLVAHDCCPVVFNHYDLIPLVYPDQYLPGDPGAPVRQFFSRVCRCLRHADRLIAISEFSRQEACAYLGIGRERISLAYPFADACFRPLPQDEVWSHISSLGRRTGTPIPEGFVLCVSHLHHAKNLRTLLRAFALLPESWRARHPLVLAFDTTAEEQGVLRVWLKEFGIADTALPTGFVSDDEMAALFNAAHLFVHPSRHEGFGLPVLEAMQCGAPVIAARAGAVPEVVGDAGILVDPDEPTAFAQAIEALDRDEARRRLLKEIGLRQASRFSPSALGESTLASYETAKQASRIQAGRRRPRIAMWTPLPPQESGVADYSGELVPFLAQWADIELFVDSGFEPSARMADAFRVYHHSAFDRRFTLKGFDLVMYQMGASHFHVFMAEGVTKWPGVVVLHDLTWSHVLYHLRGTGSLSRNFRKTLSRLEGPAAVRDFERIKKTGPGARHEALEGFLTSNPMLGEIVGTSRAVIVHYPDAKRELEARYPGSKVSWFPMGVKDPIAGVGDSVPALRERHGLSADAYVIGIFGIAHSVKRIEVVLEALARLQLPDRSGSDDRPQHNAQLVIVGAFTSREYEARIRTRALELGLGQSVHVLGRVSDREWDELLVACDVVVNLRYPFRKQMSATLMRAIAAGKPVAVTKLEEWAFLPTSFCAFVPVGDSEASVLASFLETLASDPRKREEMSRAAREYYLEHATLWRMSENYRTVVEELLHQSLREVSEMQTKTDAATPLPYNKACGIEDFRDPGLASLIREIFPLEAASGGPSFPVGYEDRQHWVIAMAVRAFRDFGVLHRDATILGVGAGTERTLFYLTEKVGTVIATDLYLSPARSGTDAPAAMLVEPERFSKYPFDRSRLTVQHMDGRLLSLPDGSVDAAFSSSSIEHFGDWTSVAASAYEMGRVLKPGGILSLAAELLIAGPTNAEGWEGVLLFDKDKLRHYIVEASGLEPVDPLDTTVSDPTLATRRDLATSLDEIRDGHRYLPHLVLVHGGQVFGSVHMVLRKTASYPARDNSWARPTESLRSTIRKAAADLAAGLRSAPDPATTGPGKSGAAPYASQRGDTRASSRRETLEAAFARWDSIRERSALQTPEPRSAVQRTIGFLKRTAKRIRDLGVAREHDRELFKTLLDYTAELEQRLAALEPRIQNHPDDLR